ncbi:hypothetical protein J3R83DRAFT_13431 [Lanmaoa asiatica]|nr:hypothetical protein J3R83DRAFT_13431 [Lanmaoa asiatica]
MRFNAGSKEDRKEKSSVHSDADGGRSQDSISAFVGLGGLPTAPINMVLFFTSSSSKWTLVYNGRSPDPVIAVNPPVTIYMGKDKVENEDLIKYAWPQDVWFHVDKLSSAHVYLRMP